MKLYSLLFLKAWEEQRGIAYRDMRRGGWPPQPHWQHGGWAQSQQAMMAPPHCQTWARQGSQLFVSSGCGVTTLAAASSRPGTAFVTRTSSRTITSLITAGELDTQTGRGGLSTVTIPERTWTQYYLRGIIPAPAAQPTTRKPCFEASPCLQLEFPKSKHRAR